MAISISVKVTVPDSLIHDAQVRNEIENTLRRRTGPQLKTEFDKTIEGWENRPSFIQKFSSGNDYLAVTVYTTQEQYAIVNYGSPAHTITPRRGGLLRFQPGYRAATRPRIISSRAKQRSGSFVTSRGVSHPGFEARAFDETIAARIAPRFEQDIQEAISIGASR